MLWFGFFMKLCNDIFRYGWYLTLIQFFYYTIFGKVVFYINLIEITLTPPLLGFILLIHLLLFFPIVTVTTSLIWGCMLMRRKLVVFHILTPFPNHLLCHLRWHLHHHSSLPHHPHHRHHRHHPPNHHHHQLEMWLRGEERKVPLRTYTLLAITTVRTILITSQRWYDLYEDFKRGEGYLYKIWVSLSFSN